MRLDKFNNPIFNQADIFDLLYRGHISALPNLHVDQNSTIAQFQEYTDISFLNPCSEISSIAEFDSTGQQTWFMPNEYYNFDVEEYCISRCISDEEKIRVMEELQAFKQHNMMILLQWLKYFVDTCLKNDIVWGVGRGSSVASFVLYLLEVHRINSIKYKLDWQEFLR